MAAAQHKNSVLFVCLGNICRSPIAEAVFLSEIGKRNLRNDWLVDSAAVIDYHLGKGPEKRAIATLQKHGITDYRHKVRQVSGSDFKNFDYIFGMDDDNISDLNGVAQAVKSGRKAKLGLLGEYDPLGVRIIPDPYYEEGIELFETVYEQCMRSVRGFLDNFYESGK